MKNQSTYSSYIIYIVSIQVDKQGLDIFKQTNHVSTPNPKLFFGGFLRRSYNTPTFQIRITFNKST